MAFAAFLTTGCGVFLAACALYLLGGLILGAATALSLACALSSKMWLFMTTGFRGDLATPCTFFAETVAPLQREHVRTLVSVCGS